MSQWKCIRCTLLNGHADDTCTVCDKKRDQPTESEDYEFAKRLQQQYNESTTSRTEPKSQKHTANHRMKQTSQPIHHYASNSQNSPFVCDNNPNHSYHNASHPSQSVKPLQSSHHSIFGASNEAQSTSFIFDDNATNQSGLSHVQPPAQSRSNNSSFAFEDDVDHSSHSTSYHSQHSVNHSSLSERQSTQPNNHSTFDNDNQRIVDYVFYDAIPKNRCISSSQMVIGKIFNENDEILHDECEPYNEPIPRLNVKLRENQKKGLTWLLSRENEETQDGVRGGLLCDETEMGKTVQILSLMLVQKQKNPNERTLIITPLNLVDRWIGEIRKIAPNSFTICHYYNQKRKKITKQDIEKCDVVLSTTDTFKKAMGKTTKMWNGYTKEMWMKAEKQELLFKLNKGFFDRIVVDESHEIKNIDTVRSRAICTMASRCKYKWCLTGTPVHNDITYDLGGACRFLGIKHATYVEKFKLTDKEKDSELKLKPKFSKQKKKSMWLDVSNEFCLNRIKTFIKPIMLRRTKKYVLANDFPEKEEIIVKCALSEEERVIYNKNYDEAKKQYAQFKTTKNVMSRYVHLLGMLTKLRKICTHPCMVFNRASLLDQEGNTNVMDFASTTDVLDRMHEDIVRRINEMSSLIEYECPICFELTELNGVVLSNCGHVFCRDCCEELERQLCPICRGRFTSRDMVRIEHVLKSKQLDEKHKEEFETYKVHGIEKKSGDEGADEEIDYGKYDELLEKYCDPMCASSKINALMERLEYIEQHHNGDKVLVFSNFTHCFKIIGQTLKDKDIEYIKFDSSLSRKQRAKTLDYFNKSEECKVLLISARCASVGLNLMCANHVIFVDPRVNPGLDNQAIGRCWRIGQNKTVYVSRLIMENTIEEKILSMQQGKDSTEDTELVNLKQKSRLNERDYDELFDYKSNGNSNSNSNS
eukprot:61103_1